MLRAYGKTDKGMVREENQDSYTVQELPGGGLLAVVCDGMGGPRGGNVASRNAVNIIAQHAGSHYRPGCGSNEVRNLLLSAVSAANALIHDMAQKREELSGMGTTLLACVVQQGLVHLLHAGDSRAYLVGEEGIRQITRDHSVVQMLVESGELTQAEARTHPQRNYITRALGIEPTLDAEYTEEPLRDSLLLCTDGLTNCLEDQELLELARQNPPEALPQALVDAANRRGGPDNITAVVVTDR